MGLRFSPEGLYFSPKGLRFSPRGLRFSSGGLCFSPGGLRFSPRVFVLVHGVLGLRSWVFVLETPKVSMDCYRRMVYRRPKLATRTRT